jgi:hypothetical protein
MKLFFSSDIKLLDGINFYKIWNSVISDESRDNIWKYLHTMYLYADQVERDTNISEVMKLYKKASKIQNLEVDNSTKILFGILNNLCDNKLGITSNDDELEKRCKENDESQSEDKVGLPSLPNLPGLPNLPNLNEMNFNTDSLLSGHIGQLASEIAGEIDTTNLENSNPSEMIQNLLSGNLNNDSPVLQLVHQISNKIQNKLTSGEVNEMELFEEAQGAMKMMGGNNKNSPFNMLHKMTEKMHNNSSEISSKNKETPDDIAKQMEDMLKSTGIDPTQINNIANNINLSDGNSCRINENNDKRKILKEKLKKKKQLMETKKKIGQLKNNIKIK